MAVQEYLGAAAGFLWLFKWPIIFVLVLFCLVVAFFLIPEFLLSRHETNPRATDRHKAGLIQHAGNDPDAIAIAQEVLSRKKLRLNHIREAQFAIDHMRARKRVSAFNKQN